MKRTLSFVVALVLSSSAYFSTAKANENLGAASAFNLFVLEDFRSTSSDVQGRLAAGGDVQLDSYGVASTIDTDPSAPTLIVGGDLAYGQGKIFTGSALVGGSIDSVNETVIFGLESGASVNGNASTGINFTAEFSSLSQLSNNLASAESTGSVEYKWGGIYLTGDCSSATQVFNLSGETVLNSNHITLNCVPSSATIVFNIDGSRAGFKNIGLSQFHSRAPKILYNFHQATTVEFTWVGVEGTVLAPLAHLDNPRGQVNGTVIAKSWNGPMELHHFPFTGDLASILGEPNQAPVANAQSLIILEDQPLAISLSADDADGDALTFTLLSSPVNGTLSGNAPDVSYQPNADFNGSDSFTFAANDGTQNSAPATITLVVAAVNDRPTAEAQSLTVDEDSNLAIQLVGDDVDGAVQNYAVTTQPENGTLTGEGSNLSYTPNANFTGSDSFAFITDDGELQSLPATVQISVLPVNDLPIANSQTVETLEDSSVSLILSGFDAESSLLSYELVSNPAFGQLSGATPNLVYTPNSNFNGQDTFQFTVSDGSLSSQAASVQITVIPVNDAPVALAQSLTTDEDTLLAIALVASDIESDTLSYTVLSQPENGVLSGSGANLSYQPADNFNGTDQFSFNASDGALESAATIVSIVVTPQNDAPLADSQNLETDEDEAFAIVLSGSDVDGQVLSYIVKTQPQNGSVSGQGANFTYTPNSNFNGEDSFSFVSSDGQLESDDATITINVKSINDLPTASNVSASTEEDSSLEVELSGSDIDGDSLSYELVGQPANGSATISGGVLTYTPNDNFNGTDLIAYRVNDGSATSANAQVSITVAAVNDAPIANPVSSVVDEDSSVDIELSGSDVDGDQLSYELVETPANGTATVLGNIITYTPNENFNGIDSISYRVTDGSATSPNAQIAITIAAVNDAPVADAVSTAVDEDNSIEVELSGSDIDGDQLSYELLGQAVNGSATISGNILSYTPNENFTGTDSITYRANDGSATSANAQVSITVAAVNDAPVANAVSSIVDEDSSIDIELAGSDVDGDQLNYEIVEPPVSGIATVSGNILSYTPNNDFNGTDSLSYRVSDGSEASSSAQITITVGALNDAPSVNDISVSTNEDTSIDIELSGSDIDGDPLTYELVGVPANGVATITSGVLSYTPNKNFNGTVTVTYRANDGSEVSSTAQVTLTIAAVNDLPVAENASIALAEDGSINVDLIALDVDGDALTFELVGQAQSGSTNLVGNTLSYTPSINFNGQDTISFKVSDGIGESNVANVSFSIEAVNDQPTVSELSLSTEQGKPVSITLVGEDIDNDALTFSITTEPLQGIAVITGNTLTYTPNSEFSGSDSLGYVANDGDANSAAATVFIEVTSSNSPPRFTSAPTAFVVQGKEWVYQATAVDDDGDALTFSSVSLPDGAVFDASTGRLVWQTTTTEAGNYEVSIAVSDGSGADVVQSFSIEVLSDKRLTGHEGFDFWIPISKNNKNGANSVYNIHVYAREDATQVSIELPALGISEQLTLSAGEIQNYEIPLDSVYDAGGYALDQVINGWSLHLTANNPISIYVINQRPFTTDAFLALPVNSLGREYVLADYELLVLNPFSFNLPQTSIVAVEDGTIVDVDPVQDLFLEKEEELIRIEKEKGLRLELNKGDVYRLSARASWRSELTGSLLKANKPIAVFGENPCAFVPDTNRACDHLVEQILPISSLGTEYFTAPLYGASDQGTDGFDGDIFRIVAPYNGTKITINGILRANLDAKEFYEFAELEPQLVESSKPVLMVQYGTSSNFGGSTKLPSNFRDPFMLLVPPKEHYLSEYVINTPTVEIDLNFVNVLVPTNSIDSMTMDGNLVAPANFIEIGDSGYSYAQFEVTEGSHAFSASEPFGLYVYGYSSFESYGYLGGLALDQTDQLTNLTWQAEAKSATTGEEACQTVLATDSNQQPINGAQVRFSISGIHNIEKYSLTNSLGEALVCYTPFLVGQDEIIAVAEDIQSEKSLVNLLPSIKNIAPQILSVPSFKPIKDVTYAYQLNAIDPEGEALSYELITGNIGTTIDANGLLQASSPAFREINEISIKVTDSAGAAATQTFRIQFAPVFNTPPSIDNVEVGNKAIVGVPFVYNPTAADLTHVATSDIDKDSSYLSLIQGPEDASITRDEFLGGSIDCNCIERIDWVPSSVGEYDFELGIRDVRGTVGENKAFSVSVVPNRAPVITSIAPNKAAVRIPYLYVVHVDNDVEIFQNYNLDELEVIFVEKPDGMTTRLEQGGSSFNRRPVINWYPTALQVGVHTLKFYVKDAVSQSDIQSVDIEVFDNNRAPIITSTNLNSITGKVVEVDILFTHQVVAEDPDGDLLSYELIDAPVGLEISDTGLLTWTPTADQVDINHTVRIVVRDSKGGIDSQRSGLQPKPFKNRAPVLELGYLPATAKVGKPFSFQVVASDREGDAIEYTLLSDISGMTISPAGLIEWTPTETGEFSVGVQVSNESGRDTEYWSIQVVDTDKLLAIDIAYTPSNVVALGEIVSLQVIPINAQSSVDATLEVDGVTATLDEFLKAEVTANKIGRTNIKLTLDDGGTIVSRESSILVPDPNDETAPTIELVSPLNNAVITEPIDIIGSVMDDNLSDVFLVYKRTDQSDEEYIKLYQEPEEFDNKTLATFDPTLLMNGSYIIILQGTDSNGLVASKSVVVDVEGNMKVGAFSVSFEDLNVPLTGIPIQITRTYDSRRKDEALAFGNGWTIDYQNVLVQENVEPTQGWFKETRRSTFLLAGGSVTLDAACIDPIGTKRVNITLPNGDIERFTVKAKPTNDSEVSDTDPSCYLVPDNFFNLEFVPESDTDSTLTSPNTDSLFLSGSEGNLSNLTETSPRQINNYVLTTRAGYIYNLDQRFGVRSIIDPNGNSIDYSDSGIVHSSGAAVVFERDAQNRITKIIDPKGNETTYLYSSSNNLLAVSDPDSKRQDYRYDNKNFPKLLTTWNNRRNKNVIKNIYDENGRLEAQEDADGNRTEFNHDLSGRVSTVVNRRGFMTQLNYDERGNVINQVDALGNISSATFDGEDNQLSSTNELGFTSYATFDENDDQLTQTDELGNQTTFTYNALGQELSIVDALGNEFENTYDLRGNLLSIKDPLGNQASTVIDSSGQATQVTDVLGNSTSYTYDAEGRKATETDSEGNVRRYTYDDNGNTLSETQQRLINGVLTDETTTYVYDELDQLISTTDALGNITQTEYDAAGNETAQIDALGRRTTMFHDSYNRLISTRYPDSSTSTNAYDPEGNLITEVDQLRRTTRHEYDALNRLVQTTAPDGGITRTEYDAAGRVSAQIDANGNRTTYTYDAAGRRTETTDALGNVTRFEYDAEGNQSAMVDANGNRTSYVYNALDQKIQTVFQNASSMQEGLDALSRKTSMTDQAGVVTNYQYDTLGRLIKVIDALGQETTYTYDEVGNKLTQTDAEGRTTAWAYDALGRVISRTLPLGQTESMVYDAVGNMVEHTNLNGQVAVYSYDVINRLLETVYENGLSETYTYDRVGNRTTSVKIENGGSARINYRYDSMNRLTTENQFTSTSDFVNLNYEYDAQGNRISLTTTTNRVNQTRVTRYTFDALNRLKTVQDHEANTTTYNYDAVGNRTGMSHANGIQTGYVYDELNRLTSLTHKDATNVTLKQFDYSLLANGKRNKIEEENGRVTDYSYDLLYRLTKESIFDPQNASHTAEYTYDKVGNRVFEVVNGVSTQYTVDANDRLVQTGGTIYTHDAQGNTLSETLDGNLTTYSYNAKQEMSGSVKAGVATAYLYNTDGIRIGQGNATEQTLYVLDNNRAYPQVVMERVNGDIAVNYTYGDDLVSQERDATISTYHYDGLGSTRVLSNDAGAVTDAYDYEAFGEVLNQTGITENNYLFTGEQYDGGLGQYYLRARYYNQGIGRFTQMDTWMGINSDPVTLHKYLYGNVDPVNNIDPSGNLSLSSLSGAFSVRGILTGAAIGGGFGGVDAALGGDDIFRGAASGALAGAILSPLAWFESLRKPLATTFTALGFLGAADSARKGNYAQAGFRGISSVLGAYLFVKTSIIPSRVTVDRASIVEGQGFSGVWHSRTGKIVLLPTSSNPRSTPPGMFPRRGTHGRIASEYFGNANSSELFGFAVTVGGNKNAQFTWTSRGVNGRNNSFGGNDAPVGVRYPIANSVKTAMGLR